MQDITIDINNFDLINFINIHKLKNNFGYITKAKDCDDQNGILIFIPSINIYKEINILKD